MIDFRGDDTGLFLIYSGENEPDLMWALRRLRNDPPLRIRKCFFFESSDLVRPKMVLDEAEATDDTVVVSDRSDDRYEGELTFKIGGVDGEYFRLSSSALGTKHRFFVHRDIRLDVKFFVAWRDISILRRLDGMIAQDLRIGGPAAGAMPEAAYRDLIKRFPTTTELDRYAAARIDACIRDHVDTKDDEIEKYHAYLSAKLGSRESDILRRFAKSELEKYRFIAARLREMLDSEQSYTEAQWQKEILDIVRSIFPKYIRVFEKVRIQDTINGTWREIDFLLVDFSGHIDVIEIKKPFNQRAILSTSAYRHNFMPARELSGSVMQVEKYLFYLAKWGGAGERSLTKKYQPNLPPGLTLKIVNPKGIVILGRSAGFNDQQRLDFEVIKRKYRSVADVISYDDLVERISTLVETFSQLASQTPGAIGDASKPEGETCSISSTQVSA